MRLNIYLLLPVFLPLFGLAQSLTFSGAGLPPAFSVETDPREIAPPRIFQPVIQPDGSGLLFQWERPVVSGDSDVEYELLLQTAGTPAYITTTTKNEIRFTGEPALKYNQTYQVQINTRISDATSSYIIYGDKNVLEFTYLPECTIPRNVVAGSKGQQLVLSWEGPLASENAVRYEVEYYPNTGGNATNKKHILISSGENRLILKEAFAKYQYNIRIRKLCDGAGATFENASEWVEVGPVGFDVPAQESVLCGGPYADTGCPGTPAPENATFSQLTLRGFLIDVIHMYHTGERPAHWEGTGYMHLPFQNKKVKVNFTAYELTNAGVICDGNAEGISDLPAYWPNFYPPVSPTNEICLPAGTQVGFDPNTGLWMPDGTAWNPQGFGPDSLYIKEPPYDGYSDGAPFDSSGLYDPWGFDANCQNVNTGTEFDINGCSCYETDIYGNPCQHTEPPYYWLNENNPLGAPTQEGLTFANEQKNNIKTVTQQYLNTVKIQIQVKIDSISDACDSLRQIMTGLVDELNYDSAFIFGPSGEYFEEGMHNNFASRPDSLQIKIDRDARTIKLEREHVHLYDCDKNGSKEKDYKKVIEYFQTTAGLDSLVNALLELVKRFTPEEVTKYGNPDSLAVWVKTQVQEQIDAKFQELYGASYGAADPIWPDAGRRWAAKREPGATPQKSPWEPGAALALGPGDGTALWQSMQIRDEDLAFEFAQGFEEIYGVDRAYFLEYIAEERRKAEMFPGFFTAHDSMLQPIEIKKWVGGRYYYVYLDKIKVEKHPDPSQLSGYGGSATLDVYLLMDIPTLDQKIVLKALGVNFTPTGPEVAPIKLELNNDIALRMSNAIRIILKKSPDTHIKVDCDGFVGISLTGEVEVCRKYLIPLDYNTLEPLPEPERVSGSFTIQLDHWSQFYTTITFDRFAVTGYEDFKWVIDNVTFDFSDDQSPAGLPPVGYSSPLAGPSGFSNAWQGVYIQNLAVHLPKQFSKNNQTTSIGVERVLIDERGFSGTAKVTTPLITLGNGSAGGWAFSVDNFKLTFIANQLTDGGFGGKINVPIISGAQCNPNSNVAPEDCFDYSAKIMPGNSYQMIVSIPQRQSYCADLWKAGTVTIHPSSTITLSVTNGAFVAKAVLNGSIKIDAQIGSFELTMPDTIGFQNLTIRNTAPYFSLGTWQMPSSVNCEFNGFGITVSSPQMKKGVGDTEYYLNLGLAISLTKDGAGQDSLGIVAKANLKIYGELNTPGGQQRWRFKEVKVSSVTVDASFPGAKIKGELAFYDDGAGTWGKGFRGILDAKFETIKIDLKALAQFGRNSGSGGTFKYFFVDAKAVFGTGIPLFPGVELIGFGGGVYHRMSRASSGPGLPANPTPSPDLPANLGVSLSGVQYNPDITAGLGLKATVVIALPKEEAFNANLTLEALFNSKASGGGLRSIDFEGIAYFMTPVKITVAPEFSIDDPAVMKAKAVINVQFTPKFKLHGDLETFLKVGDVIEGLGPNGRVTNTEFHIEEGKWYINMGTPAVPQGLRLSLGGLTLAEIGMYMDIGNNIPPMPPLPAKVKALTGMGNFMANESLRASGNGFAFGASVKIGDGTRKCVPDCDAPIYFYAKILAMAGFDLMLQDYGDATCSNMGNGQLGINGWYASGQAYMLMEAAVGVGFKLFGVRKEMEILGVGAAAAVQMKLPNPFWAKGAVGGKFSVLGGLVKGDIKFNFTIGNSCQISGGSNPSDNLQVITNFDPISGAEQVDVAVHPGITFSLPIGKDFELSDANGTAVFKTELAYARLKYEGYYLPVTPVWQDDNMFLELVPLAMLPENDSVTLEVKVNIYKNNQALTPEIKTAGFWTGYSYEEIPDFNVKASYPIDGQYNFYPSEWMSQKGYILLNANQPDLLDVSAQNGRLVARITPSSGQAFENPVTYIPAQAKIEFPMPAAKLPLQTLFKLELIKKVQPLNSNNSGQENSNNKSASSTPGIGDPEDKVIFDVYFRTSQYPSFYDKIAGFATQQGASLNGGHGTFKNPVLGEKFDEYEIKGTDVGDMVFILAKLEQTNWFTSYIKPLIYNKYGGNQPNPMGIWVNERPAEPLGRIPAKAVSLEAADGGASLHVTADHFASGTAPVAATPQYMNYLAPHAIASDYHDICTDVWNYLFASAEGLCCMQYNCCYYVPVPNQTCSANCGIYDNAEDFRNNYYLTALPNQELRNLFLGVDLTPPYSGAYPLEVTYKLPGLGNTTSIRSINLQH